VARRGLSQKSHELAISLARMIPLVLDNERHKLADVLSGLLAATQGKPFDVVSTYSQLICQDQTPSTPSTDDVEIVDYH